MTIPQNYTIGVIADTHDRWIPRVAELFREADEIWHLGDVCGEPILDELRAINSKLKVVLVATAGFAVAAVVLVVSFFLF